MDNIFRKFCYYYLNDGTEDDLEELKKLAQDDFIEIQRKAIKLSKRIINETAKLGFSTDFEGFCNLLEAYINKKAKLSDKEKSIYLKILMTLSEIHEINLREELERYVSYKDDTLSLDDEEIQVETKSDEKEIFNKFCYYNLKSNSTTEEFNELKELATNLDLDFKEIQKQSIIFVEEIRILAENLGYEIDTDSFDVVMSDYLNRKNELSDQKKAQYLKVLLYLSDILNIDLRNVLEIKKQEEKQEKIKTSHINIKTSSFIESISNPLDNEELLSLLLEQRYHNGYFDASEIFLASEKEIIESKEYDYLKMHADLTYKVQRIFLDKFNNYAFDDLNERYTNLITEVDLERLETLTREEIYDILIHINKQESPHYISKKFKLTDNLYNFILESTSKATDIKTNHIGIGDNSLFINNEEQSTIQISLYGPEFESNLLLNEYIKKCIENNLNYDLLSYDYERKRNRLILLANTNDIKEKITILDEIVSKYPSWSKAFKQPILSTGTINNSIYGISLNGIEGNDEQDSLSYNDYFNILCEISYYRILAKIIVGIINDEKASATVNNFIKLDNIKYQENTNPLTIEYNSINFETIKDLINQYIPLVTSTLNIYMTEQDKKEELLTEFKKSLMYISNIIQNREKRTKSNIAISRLMEETL